jgi:hypothetical protein
VRERKVFKDYEESHVRDTFARADPTSWQDLVRYLETEGAPARQSSPGESAHMIADAKQAMKDNVPFAYNPESAFRVMRSHRNPELVRQEEQYWLAQLGDKHGESKVE